MLIYKKLYTMRTRVFLIVLLFAIAPMIGHTQSKNTFPFGETVEDNTHKVIGKTPIHIDSDLAINLSATTPYTTETVNEDAVKWFIHLKPYYEKPYKVNKGGKLLLKLGDGTTLSLTAEKESQSINLGNYRADGEYMIEKSDLEKIFANGIVKWRMEIDHNEPLEKTYTEDAIGKRLKEIYQIIEPAICQKNVWNSSHSQATWTASKKAAEVTATYRDFMQDGIRNITPDEFTSYDPSHLFQGVALGAFVSNKNEVQWLLTFFLAKNDNFFIMRDDLFLRLGDGAILNFPLAKTRDEKQNNLYTMQVAYSLTSTEIEKIVNQGILKFQTKMDPSGNENPIVYLEYPEDILGNIIRGQYQYIQNTLNRNKTFDTDF